MKYDLMLPTKHDVPFSRKGWLFEPKLDGYRGLCVYQNGVIRLFSKQHKELTKRFPDLSTIGHAIKADSAVLDGEIVALDKDGRPCFSDLQGHRECFIVYFAFDLLELNGNDLTNEILLERKKALKRIIKKSPRLRLTESVAEDGEGLFAAISELQLEGMVAKKADSLYIPGKTKLWLKIKTESGKAEMKKRIETWGHTNERT